MDESINNILQQQANIYKLPPPPDAWHTIAMELHHKKQNKYLWLLWSVPFVIICSTFIPLHYAESNKKIVAKNKLETEISPNTKNLNSIDITINKNDIATITSTKTVSNKSTNNYLIIINNKLRSTKSILPKINKTIIVKREVTNNVDESPNNTNEYYVVPEVDNEIITNYPKTDTTIIEKTKPDIPIQISKPKAEKSLAVKSETILKPNKKWNSIFQVGLEKVFIKNNAGLNNTSEKNSSLFSPSQMPIQSITIFKSAKYTSSKAIALAFVLQQNNTKKTKLQLGVQLQLHTLNTYAYKALPAFVGIANNQLYTDSVLQLKNSNYDNIGNNVADIELHKLKMRATSYSILLGVQTQLFKIATHKTLQLQTQLQPTYIQLNNMQWYNTQNGRFFTNNNITNKFNIVQNATLLFANNGKYKYTIGPTISLNYQALNKSITYLQNTYKRTVGLQFQYFIK